MYKRQDVYGVFAIVPCSEEAEAENFVVMLEQTCRVEQEWACGLSKYKRGIRDLREGYREAEYARRYHMAVSYTHLDVYKRQIMAKPMTIILLATKVIKPNRTMVSFWG